MDFRYSDDNLPIFSPEPWELTLFEDPQDLFSLVRIKPDLEDEVEKALRNAPEETLLPAVTFALQGIHRGALLLACRLSGERQLKAVIPDLVQLVKTGTPEEQYHAALALGSLHHVEIIPEVRNLLSIKLSPYPMAYALLKFGPEGESCLIEAANSPDPAVRASACEVLSLVNDSRAIEILNERIDDKESKVRSASLFALSMLKDPVYFQVFASRLSKVPEGSSAALGLARLGSEACDYLIECVRSHPDAMARYHALRGLGSTHYPPSLAAFIAALDDSNPTIQREAVQRIGQWGDPKVARYLERFMMDSDPQMQVALKRAFHALRLSQSYLP